MRIFFPGGSNTGHSLNFKLIAKGNTCIFPATALQKILGVQSWRIQPPWAMKKVLSVGEVAERALSTVNKSFVPGSRGTC